MTEIRRRVNSLYVCDPSSYIGKIREYHRQNFEQVGNGLRHVEGQLRKAIASSAYQNIQDDVLTFTRLYSMLLSVWCEARLHVLIYEESVFTEHERSTIYNQNSLEQRWLTALAIAVKKNGNIQFEEDANEDSLGIILFTIYERIKTWISGHLAPVIRNRNKVAHGQWLKPFQNTQDEWVNSTSFTICPQSIQDFKKDSILFTNEKMKLLNIICGAINSIAIGSGHKKYNVQSFDEINRLVNKQIDKIEHIDYLAFVKRTQKSYKEQFDKAISHSTG
ncbi:hypothetical protein KDV38_09675 [Providencia rettgeri]